MRREPETPLSAPARLAWPGFELDLARGELLDAHGRPAILRAQALKVLLVLGERAGQVVGKDELMRRVWGDVVVTEDSLVQAVGDIRRVLGDAGHRRVRTLPRRGYLLVVDAEADTEAGTEATTATAAPGWPAWLGVVLLLLAVGVVGWAASGPREDAPARSLAILPFEGDDGTDGWFVDGVTGDLAAIVATWTGLRVIGRGTMATYQGRNADPREVGRELGVRHVLTGRARRDGDRVRLAVSLVEARSGRVVWSELRDVPRGELAALVGDVAGGIARTLTVAYGDAVAADTQALAPHQVQADDLALQGVAELLRTVSREGWERARHLLEAAVALDPDCPRCLGGLSLVHSNLVIWGWTDDRAAAIARAEQAAARLEQIAPDASITLMARASLAHIHRDWAGVLAVGDRLVAHYPNEPTSHHHRCSALLRLGRFDESIAACERALRISPRDSRVSVWQGLTGFDQFQLGRHAPAEQALRASVLANPRVPFYGVLLAATLAEQGRHDEAAQVLRDVRARHPDYRVGSLVGFWTSNDPRFLSGRDRVVAAAGALGLPP